MPTPFVPAANVAEVQLFYRLYGQKCENTMYYQFFTEPTPDDLAALSDKLLDLWTTDIMSHLSHELTLVGMKVTDLTTSTSPVYEPSFPSVVGADSTTSAPGNVTICVKRTSLGRGRSSRGRIYIPGIPMSVVVGDQINSAFANDLVNSLNSIKDNMASSVEPPGVPDVVVSRVHNGAERTAALVADTVAYVLTDLNIDSQRRRLTGRGQ